MQDCVALSQAGQPRLLLRTAVRIAAQTHNCTMITKSEGVDGQSATEAAPVCLYNTYVYSVIESAPAPSLRGKVRVLCGGATCSSAEIPLFRIGQSVLGLTSYLLWKFAVWVHCLTCTPSSSSSISAYSFCSRASVSASAFHMPRPAASSMRRSTFPNA